MRGLGEPFFLGGNCAECGRVCLWRQANWSPGAEKLEIDIGPAKGMLCPEHPDGRLKLGVYTLPAGALGEGDKGYGVWRLRTYWNHGDETGDWLFTSEEAAEQQLFEYVRVWWPEDFGTTPIPDDPAAAIQYYFTENTAETYSLQPLRVRFRAHPIDEAFKAQMADSHLRHTYELAEGEEAP